MNTRSLLLLLPLFWACDSSTDKSTDSDSTATDTESDDISASETDTDTTDTEVAAEVVSIELSTDATTVSTAERVTFTVTATYDDDSTGEVTSDVTVTSSDEDVLVVSSAGEAQPLDAGTATLTASWDALSDDVEITVSVAAAGEGDLLINELLCDATVDGDPNADGSLDSVEDEFVELYNNAGYTIDLSGVTIIERDFDYLPRHTFADGTSLLAGSAVVVFGGGDVAELSADNATFLVADNEDPGYEYGLNLSDESDVVQIIAADGETVITELSYGDDDVDAVLDASLNLDPDLTGTTYAAHGDVSGASGNLSPGTLVDGSSFVGP